MMKSEFENLIGYEIPYMLYEKVEKVYMAFDHVTKMDIAEIYLTDHVMITERFFRDINKFETRNLEQQQKIEELETQLLQYKTYVDDLTYAIQKAVCKDFCPNIEMCVIEMSKTH